MRMIAIGTVQGRKTIRARNPLDPKDRGVYQDIVVKPTLEFDTEDFGMGEPEIANLIARGVAKRKTREVEDDSVSKDQLGKAAKPAAAKPPQGSNPPPI